MAAYIAYGRYYAHETEEDALVQDMNATSIFDLKWHGDDFEWAATATALNADRDGPLLKPAPGTHAAMWEWAEVGAI